MPDKRQSNRRPKQPETSPEQVVIEGVIQAFGQIASWIWNALMGKGGKQPRSNSTKERLAELQEHWGQVELHAVQESTQALAISEGDKILDNALKALGFPGDTMADRLRAAQPKFSSDLYQSIWDAHKLRNTLAHEVGAKAHPQEVQRSITTFRTALYQLGVFE